MKSESHTVIFKNPFGYVARCKCCRDVRLCLGNMLLSFNEEDFHDFKSSFFALNDFEDLQLHIEGKIRRYILHTSFTDLTLSLSKKEYEWTSEILNMAYLSMYCEAEMQS